MANAHQNDLTEGRILPALIRFSLPMIAANLLQAFYGVVDIYVVSVFVGRDGVSALNNASQITYIITNAVIGLAMGGNILIGQYFGRRDQKNQSETTVTFLGLFLVIGLMSTVFFGCLSFWMLEAIQTPAEVLSAAHHYLLICSLGIVFVYGYNAFASILRAVGNSRKPMHFIAFATVTNIVLDFLFVGVFQWNTAGAALATVCGQAVAFLMALRYFWKNREVFLPGGARWKIDWKRAGQILRLGIPTAVQMTVAGISFVVVTYLINGYGVVVSAGNGLSSKIRDICLLFINSMVNVASSMIAQNIGAQKYGRAKEVMFATMKLTVSATVVLVALIEVFAPQLVSLFQPDAEVLGAAVYNLRIEVLGQLFYAVFLSYHTLMTGAGHTLCVLGSSFTNCILFRALLGILLERQFGLTGLYCALAIAPASSIPIGWVYYKSGIWHRGPALKALTPAEKPPGGG